MTNAPTKRRSWLVPQFSLRVLLLAFTAFAIGFPIWYRWPYEEVEQLPAPGAQVVTRVTTWQRQWGGGRLKHGPERADIDGKTVKAISYRNGQKDGPYLDWEIDAETMEAIERQTLEPLTIGQPVTIGQYIKGEKDGVWTDFVHGQKKVSTWHHGKQVSP